MPTDSSHEISRRTGIRRPTVSEYLARRQKTPHAIPILETRLDILEELVKDTRELLDELRGSEQGVERRGGPRQTAA